MKTFGIICIIIGILTMIIFFPAGIVIMVAGILLWLNADKSKDNFDINPMDPEYRQMQREEDFELWKMKQEYLEEKRKKIAYSNYQINKDLDDIEKELDLRISDPERGLKGIRVLNQKEQLKEK